MNLMIILTLVLLMVVLAQLLAPKWVASEVSQNSSDIGMWIVGTIFAAMMAIGIIYAALQGSFTNYGTRLKDTSTKIDPTTWGK